MEEQVIEVEQEVIITNNSLLSHFSDHNNDLPVSKQKNGALYRIMLSLTRPYQKIITSRSVIILKKESQLRHYPILHLHCKE